MKISNIFTVPSVGKKDVQEISAGKCAEKCAGKCAGNRF